VAREAARRGVQVLEIDSNAEGEACVRLLTPAAPAGSVWAPEAAAAQQLRPCGICWRRRAAARAGAAVQRPCSGAAVQRPPAALFGRRWATLGGAVAA